MKTGCQGPFCHGTGGWCGCDCNCCPPPCCPAISVYFDCGTPRSSTFPLGCGSSSGTSGTAQGFAALWPELQLPGPPQEMPEFGTNPVLSMTGQFAFGSTRGNCSVPCETLCVTVQPGGVTPICCIELLRDTNGNKVMVAVGNGYVTGPTQIIDNRTGSNCSTIQVKINGAVAPVWVNDCDVIRVTLEPGDCCTCTQLDMRCAPCPSTSGGGSITGMGFGFGPKLFVKRTDPVMGKTKVNPRTGKPVIVLNKKELIRRLAARQQQLKRRKK